MMLNVKFDLIPQELKDCGQWCVWKVVDRDGHVTKLPYQINGAMAKSNDPETWATFGQVKDRYLLGSWDGIGFVFSDEDPYCGVDLDGCRNPETGLIVPWAKKIILEFATYAEVSPSATGVKMWVRGDWPYSGHKQILTDVERVSDKTPAIEVYDSVRYFAVTGHRLAGQEFIGDRQGQLDALRKQFWPEVAAKTYTANAEWRSPDAVSERARKYLGKMPISVNGQDGSGACFRAACVLICGFGLSDSEAFSLLNEWNAGCQPPWSEKELRHKIDGAMKTGGERGYLRDVAEKNWDRVPMQTYRLPQPEKPKPEIKINCLESATEKFIEQERTGRKSLIELGLPELDFAIGGGVELGEMVVIAARPGHGKSCSALQFCHHWNQQGRPSLFISEEMSALTLGKRTVQFVTTIQRDQWHARIDEVAAEVSAHFQGRAKCLIVESCLNSEVAAEAIRKAKAEYGIQCVVVDYAQLLGSAGKGRYEQTTNTSVVLRQITTEANVVMVALCQMSRAIEKRDRFVPVASDIKESGQFEQDADVIIFGVWPHRLDAARDKNEYQFFVTKNRSREISLPVVNCRFDPSRQMFGESQPTFDEPDEGYFGEPKRLGSFDR